MLEKKRTELILKPGSAILHPYSSRKGCLTCPELCFLICKMRRVKHPPHQVTGKIKFNELVHVAHDEESAQVSISHHFEPVRIQKHSTLKKKTLKSLKSW
jgi:hypothetical protein